MEPAYFSLYRSGELERRANALEVRLSTCDLCPRKCGVNRLQNKHGFCRSGFLPVVSAICDHHGEEPAISGTKGTGAIFFGNCNMRCLYCQNYQISQNRDRQKHKEMEIRTLAENMVYLQDKLGCHNISLVSPMHFVPQLVRAILEAVPLGLKIPIVYNTNAYESLDILRELDGIIDIYLPDLKYASDVWARKFSRARGYVSIARQAILEMHRQVGDLIVDEQGLAVKGLIVRHLILPNDIAGSRDSLKWLVEKVSPGITVSIMAQYLPCHRAPRVPMLSRKITAAEYEAVTELLDEFGIQNGWVQELDSPENYLPDFTREVHPFMSSSITKGNGSGNNF